MNKDDPPQCDCAPGQRAPKAGVYAEVNVLGTPTGLTTSVSEGMNLPAAPRGFVWRLVQTTAPR
jgi:hypothetical protein